jgi:hypothetical protein
MHKLCTSYFRTSPNLESSLSFLSGPIDWPIVHNAVQQTVTPAASACAATTIALIRLSLAVKRDGRDGFRFFILCFASSRARISLFNANLEVSQ